VIARRSRTAAVLPVTGILLLATPADPVAAARQPTAAVCVFESPVEITPALVMAEEVEGTFAGGPAPLHCAGTYEGALLAGTGSGRFTGTFRSGRPGGSLPAGTCLFVSGTATISGTLGTAQGRSIPLEASITWVSVGPLAVGGGTAGAALVDAVGQFRPDPAHPGETCFVSPLGHAVLTGQAVLMG
jgi:hypothetical protein